MILVPTKPGTDQGGYQSRCLFCMNAPPDESRPMICPHVLAIANRFGLDEGNSTQEALFFEYEPHNDVGTTWEKENFAKVCKVLKEGTLGARQVKMVDTDVPNGNVLYDDNRRGTVVGRPLYAIEAWKLQEIWRNAGNDISCAQHRAERIAHRVSTSIVTSRQDVKKSYSTLTLLSSPGHSFFPTNLYFV
jgi:hypothetical protein